MRKLRSMDFETKICCYNDIDVTYWKHPVIRKIHANFQNPDAEICDVQINLINQIGIMWAYMN